MPAAAHPVLPGVTGFPSLMLHPLLLEHQLLCVVASGLLAARSRSFRLLSSLALFAAGVMAGNVARDFVPQHGFYVPFVLTAILVSGLFSLALDRLPFMAAAGLLFALGSAIGVDTTADGPGIAHRAEAVAAAVLGSAIVMGAITAILRSPAPRPSEALRGPVAHNDVPSGAQAAMPDWRSICVRVIAAWITAAVTMMAALMWT